MSVSGKMPKPKEIIEERIVDFDTIKYADGCFKLRETFTKSGIINYFLNVQDDIYLEEWKEFFRNGDTRDQVITKVKGKEILINVDLLSTITGCSNKGYRVYCLGDWMDTTEVTHKRVNQLLYEQDIELEPCHLVAKARALQTFNKYCLAPKGGSKEKLRYLDTGLLYNLLAGREINLPFLIYLHLGASMRSHLENSHPLHGMLVYGMLVTKIMKHFGVPLGEPTIKKEDINRVSMRSFANMTTVSREIRLYRELIGEPARDRRASNTEGCSSKGESSKTAAVKSPNKRTFCASSSRKRKYRPKVQKRVIKKTSQVKGESSSRKRKRSEEEEQEEVKWGKLINGEDWIEEEEEDVEFHADSPVYSSSSVSNLSEEGSVDLSEDGTVLVLDSDKEYVSLRDYRKKLKRRRMIQRMADNLAKAREEVITPGTRNSRRRRRFYLISPRGSGGNSPQTPCSSPSVSGNQGIPSTLSTFPTFASYSPQPGLPSFVNPTSPTPTRTQPEERSRVIPFNLSPQPIQHELASSSVPQPESEREATTGHEIVVAEVSREQAPESQVVGEIVGRILEEITQEEQQQQNQEMMEAYSMVHEDGNSPHAMDVEHEEESGDTIPVEFDNSDERIEEVSGQEVVQEIFTQVVDNVLESCMDEQYFMPMGAPFPLSPYLPGKYMATFYGGEGIPRELRDYDYFEELPHKVIHRKPEARPCRSHLFIRQVFQETIERRFDTHVEFSERILPFISDLTRVFAKSLQCIQNHPLPEDVEQNTAVMRRPLRPSTKLLVELEVQAPPIQVIERRDKGIVYPHFHHHPDDIDQSQLCRTGEGSSGLQIYEKEEEGTRCKIGTLTQNSRIAIPFGDICFDLITYMLRAIHFVPLHYFYVMLSHIPDIFMPSFCVLRLGYEVVTPVFTYPVGRVRSTYFIDRAALGHESARISSELEQEMNDLEELARLDRERERIFRKISRRYRS